MLEALAERGARPPTLQKCRDHLVSALAQAVKERSWGIDHNVAAAVDAPADPNEPTADDWYTLGAAEADAFLAHLRGDEFDWPEAFSEALSGDSRSWAADRPERRSVNA